MIRFIFIILTYVVPQLGLGQQIYATWYDLHGRRTASGQLMDRFKLTCASNFYPIGTNLIVSYKCKSVRVLVNDRGGMSNNIIDLSKGAFLKLAPLRKGKIKVYVKKSN